MTPEELQVAATALGEYVQGEVMQRAKDCVAVQLAAQPGARPLTPFETEILEVGIAAGQMQSMLILQDLGVLPK